MDELKALYAQHSPQVWREVEKLGVLFQAPDVPLVTPKSWKPTGDFVGDFVSAWQSSFSGTVTPFNATHHKFNNNADVCYFKPTWAMLPAELDAERFYPSKMELGFDGSVLSAYMREYYFVPVVAVTLYMLVIFSGKLLLSPFSGMSLKLPLVLWNLLLSAFSFVGVFRTVPHLLATVSDRGMYQSVCAPACETFGAGAVGLWTALFILSKFPELVDTVFIVLRKKPLIFLHWYHHVTVLLYTWQAYATQASSGLWFVAMNFSVHSIMYLYYALKAVGMWPRFIPSFLITLLQLAQMVGGIAICMLTYKYQTVDKLPCATSAVSFQSGVVMYASYFVLFLQILFSLLGPKKRSAASSAKKTQ